MRVSKVVAIMEMGLAAVTFLAACQPAASQQAATSTPGNTITDIVWRWESVTNQTTSEKTTVPVPRNYTITFKTDGTFTGKADCNNISGIYSQKNGFSIKVGSSTLAYCGENSMDQQYITLLNSIAAGGPDGAGGLALETAGGEQRMLFSDGGAAK